MTPLIPLLLWFVAAVARLLLWLPSSALVRSRLGALVAETRVIRLNLRDDHFAI